MLAASTVYAVPPSEAYGQVTTEAPKVATAKSAVSSNSKTEAAVREYFKDIPVMIQVARCESQFRHILADGSVLHGVVDNADTGRIPEDPEGVGKGLDQGGVTKERGGRRLHI